MAKKNVQWVWRSAARRAALGVLGAAVLATETVRETARKCVARGEQMAPALRKRIGAMRRSGSTAGGKVSRKVGETLAGWKARLPFASRQDVAALAKRIDMLSKRIVKQAQPASA